MMQKMINYTKKWWLLGCHHRAERIHSTRGDNTGRRVLISQAFFIEGNPEGEWKNKGLANKFNPYVGFRLSHLIFWKKEYNDEQLKIKRHTYHDIYEVCVKEGFITGEKTVKDDKESIFPSVSNEKAYNIRGFPLGYLEGLFLTYDKVWFAVGALAIALIGSSLFSNRKPIQPVINVAPTINTPDVNPTINVYPK